MRASSLLALGAATLLPFATAQLSDDGGDEGGALGATICKAATVAVWNLPVPGDCTRFVKCEVRKDGTFTGLSTFYTCDRGLHFNAATQTCDWPDLAGCKIRFEYINGK
ncbi:hypothetical protein MGYG_02307 [Nannizzia gypsea CBS 118893]|uniref:Chitin-binding type-2 domain-containing protein n=1 Tax=Arthroderma gypseum (strain ATCC MYA-4604 / CBS 118893) TaxID=535722 RepID=E4UQW9_ARTGP|nr:hypothetical protein MGYG_02307 [Nannizzia gypsea CBS 118893]EFQ99295.1 hypothetical protein MGYG_02307 [Nannizzia gypsea CBS 118893]